MSFKAAQLAYDNMSEPEYPDYRESEYLVDKLKSRFDEDFYEKTAEDSELESLVVEAAKEVSPLFKLREKLYSYGLSFQQVQDCIAAVIETAMYELSSHLSSFYGKEFDEYFDNNVEKLVEDLNDPC